MVQPASMVEIWRGPFQECVHSGHAVICNAAGEIVEGWGDPDRVVLSRSASKMIQALPLVQSGAADAAGLTDRHLSLALEAEDPAKPEILAIGAMLLAVAALFQLVDGAQVIALGVLRGVQDTRVPMIMAAVSYWLIGIPCSYVLGFTFGLEGVGIWLGLVLGLSAAAVLLMARFWGPAIRTVGVATE